MKHLNKIAVFIFLGLFLWSARSFADISKKVSFQGRLTDNAGVPITGTKNFVFKIFNKSNAQLWTSNFDIEVKNGMYSASLNLATMDSDYFANELYLDVELDGDKIVNRAELTASPYAFSVSDLAITESKIADKAVTNLKIKDGAVTESKIADKAVTGKKIADKAVTEGKIADKAVTFNKLSASNEGDDRFLKMNNNTLSWANIPSSLPEQSGHVGRYLKTNGSIAMWSKLEFTGGLTESNGEVSVKFPLPAQFPSLSGHSNKFLTVSSDGSNLLWTNIPSSLPEQPGHVGEYLKTDGSIAMWSKLRFIGGLTENDGEVSVKFPLPAQFPSLSGHGNKFLTNNGTNLSWEDLSSSYVTTDTVQIITGKKTFNEIISSNLTIGGSVLSYGHISGSINTTGLIIVSSTNIKGNLNVTGATYNENADLAEIYPSSELLNPGDVVVISQTRDGYIEKSKAANDTKAAGVISTSPGIVLNSEATGYKLALVGKVPVNITNEGGSVKRGDLLVTSSLPGYAMKAPENPKPGTIIGKALENFTGSRGKILALVNLQ